MAAAGRCALPTWFCFRVLSPPLAGDPDFLCWMHSRKMTLSPPPPRLILSVFSELRRGEACICLGRNANITAMAGAFADSPSAGLTAARTRALPSRPLFSLRRALLPRRPFRWPAAPFRPVAA